MVLGVLKAMGHAFGIVGGLVIAKLRGLLD